MPFEVVAGQAAFGEANGTGVGASFAFHGGTLLDATGKLILTTHHSTGLPIVPATSKVRTLDLSTLATTTPVSSVAAVSEKYDPAFGYPFPPGSNVFVTTPSSITEGPAGFWLLSYYRRDSDNRGLTLTLPEFNALPIRDPIVFDGTWRYYALANKTTGAVSEVASRNLDFFTVTPARSLIPNPSNPGYLGFTTHTVTVDRLAADGTYIENLTLSIPAPNGIDPVSTVQSAVRQGTDIWVLTSGPNRIFRLPSGLGGPKLLVLGQNAYGNPLSDDPGPSLPHADWTNGRAIAVSETHIYYATLRASTTEVWCIDKAFPASKHLMVTLENSLRVSLDVYGEFLYCTLSTAATTRVYKVPACGRVGELRRLQRDASTRAISPKSQQQTVRRIGAYF